jgi:hypothetical protein
MFTLCDFTVIGKSARKVPYGAGKRFTYMRSELMAPYGTFLADLPIVFVYIQFMTVTVCLHFATSLFLFVYTL